MNEKQIFVGRKEELEEFKKVLEDPQGQAILVVGQSGMGKSMLVNKVVEQAEKGIIGEEALNVKCWSVCYQITPIDDVNKTMEQIIIEATDAANPVKTKLGMTGASKEKWQALFGAGELIPVLGPKIKALGELLLSWGNQTAGDTRKRFIEALKKLSECLSNEQRAIFIIDPEKWMPKDSDQAWRLVTEELPSKIKLIFPQRPDDVLVTSDNFCLSDTVKRIPDRELDILDEQAINDLVDKYAKMTKYNTRELLNAVACYNRHPYVVAAALELIKDGLEIQELPNNPKLVAIAEAQRKRIFEKSDEAIALFEAYAILEVGVPDDIAEYASGLNSTTLKRLQNNNYLKGLLREEGEGKRIYHSILADYILGQINETEKKQYHKRAIKIYRGKLKNAEEEQIKPDELAATRLPEHVLIAEGQDAFVSSFINECFSPLLTLGALDTCINLSERALKMVREDSEDGAILLGNLGVIYRSRGELDKAEEMHKKALAIDERLGLQEGMARDYGNLGVIYGSRGDLVKAEEMFNKGLKIDEKLGRLEGLATKYGNLGIVYKKYGELDKAEEMHKKALEIDKRMGNQEGIARHYSNLGVVYQTRGQWDKAEEMFNKGLAIDEKLGRLEGMASDYGNIGGVYLMRGDSKKAEEYWIKSLDLYKKMGLSNEAKEVQGWIDSARPN